MRKILKQSQDQQFAKAKGQTLVLFLALASACVAVFLIVFNVGQVASEKEKLANTADAAAYSAAMTEARTLNFESYMNRGIVANEVFIAQVVSFDSWVNYIDDLANNLADVTVWIPIVDEITAAIAEAASTVTSVVNNASGFAIKAADALGFTALPKFIVEPAHAATYLAMMDVAKTVVAQNVTTFGGRVDTPAYITAGGNAELLLNEAAWNNFTSVANSAAVPAQVVLDSRDGFSRTRNGSPLDFTLPLIAKGRKTGGTLLSSNYDRWDAQDYYGIATWSWRNMDWGSPTKVGEGDASADKNSSSNSQYSRSWLAEVNDMDGFHGIPKLRDINNPGPTGPKTSLYFLIEIGKDNGNIKTSSNSNMGVGSLSMPENLSGGRLTVASKAAVSFQRPSDSKWDKTAKILFRSDGTTNGYVEYGSLYSPYWQVNLVPVALSDKALLAAANNISNPQAAAKAAALTPFTP